MDSQIDRALDVALRVHAELEDQRAKLRQEFREALERGDMDTVVRCALRSLGMEDHEPTSNRLDSRKR